MFIKNNDLMGYNGGINKRGYYRRNNGMYSKSASKKTGKIVGDTFATGIGLFSALGSLPNEAINKCVSEPKQLDMTSNEFSFFVRTIIAIMCPILGFYFCYFEYWSLTSSLILFGAIEFLVFVAINVFPYDLQNEYYFERSLFHIQMNHSRKIILGGLIVNSILALLNTYAIYLLLDSYNGNDKTIASILAIIKIGMNIGYAFSFFRTLRGFDDIKKFKWDQINHSRRSL